MHLLKRLFTAGLLGSVATSAAAELVTAPLPPDLQAYRWQHRLLVLRAPADDDPAYRRQLAVLAAVPGELAERDLRVFTEFGAPRFSIELIGKDGGRKDRRATVLDPTELFAIIDAMPMRRAEMRRAADSS